MKFKSNIEVQAGLKDSSGSVGTSGQVLSSTGSNVSWINQSAIASDVQNQVKAGVAINKGQAVYVTGADGTNIIVGLASNTSEATSSKTLGLLNATVAINGFADVVQIGRLAGLNTIGANAGDPVWLGTNGNLIYGLINKPYAPAHLVFLGIVTRVNANNGEIFVNVQNGFELNEIHDVDLKTTVPVNGDILGFNGTLWVNKTIAQWLGYTPVNANGTVNYVSKFTGATTLGDSQIIDNGTNVGIGTSNPNAYPYGEKLSVNGNISIGGTKIGFGTTDSFVAYGWYSAAHYGISWAGNNPLALSGYYGLGFFTNGSEKMRVTPGGEVGIGTTSPGQKLEVNGNIKLSSTVGSTATPSYINLGLDYSNGTTKDKLKVYLYNSGGEQYGFTVGSVSDVQYHSNAIHDFYLNNSSAVRINSTGLGIGTTTPSAKLDVNGRALVNEFQYTKAINISGANLNDYTFAGFYNGEGMVNAPNSGWFWVTVERYSGDDNWAHQTATTFGSGNTANEVYTRTKTGGTWTNWKRLIDWGDVNGTTNYVSKFTGNNSLGISSIFDNGNAVGINTTNPGFITTGRGVLSLNGASTSLMEFQTGSGFKSYLYQSGTSFEIYETNTLTIAVGGSERIRVANNGNVGIGTSSPGYKLDVVGTGKFSSNLLTTGRLGVGYVNNSFASTVSAISGDAGAALFSTFDNSASTQASARFSTADLLTGCVLILPRLGAASFNGLTSANSSGIISIVNNPLIVGVQDGSAIQFTTTDIRIGTNNSEKMRITSSGDVGIGTTTPAEKLDVYGVIRGLYTADPGAGAITSKFLAYSPAPYGLVFRGYNTGAHSIQVQREANNAELYSLSLQPNGSNVGIGTISPNASAILHLRSTTQGFLPPVMRTGERDSISSPAAGLMIFNEDDEVIQVYTNGSGWRTLAFL